MPTGAEIKSFLVIHHSGNTLPLSIVEEQPFSLNEVETLIWGNNGLYTMLSADMVEGLLVCYRQELQLSQLDVKKDARYIHWDDMVPLDAKVAKLLFQ